MKIMANFVDWKEQYNLGIDEIDTQHRKIFEIINNFSRALEQSKQKENLPAVLGELVSYAEYHFSTEEKYFEEFNFEGKDDHIKKHNKYREKITQFLENNEEEEEELSLEMLAFMKDWCLDHIVVIDCEYVDCLHGRGLH